MYLTNRITSRVLVGSESILYNPRKDTETFWKGYEMQRVTLREARATLGISYPTLRKWIRRLGIDRVQHPRDERFWTLTDEQVDAIRAARAEMPGSTAVAIRRPTPIRTIGSLPDGLVSWHSFAAMHHIPEMTAAKAISVGRLPIVAGHWKAGRTYVKAALDEQGRCTFHELWAHRPSFIPCIHCPHAMPQTDALRPGEHNTRNDKKGEEE